MLNYDTDHVAKEYLNMQNKKITTTKDPFQTSVSLAIKTADIYKNIINNMYGCNATDYLSSSIYKRNKDIPKKYSK